MPFDIHSRPLQIWSTSGAIAQLVRALPCHGRGCGFESRWLRQLPDVFYEDRVVAPKAIGVAGFEPATSWSQTRRTTKLCYTPVKAVYVWRQISENQAPSQINPIFLKIELARHTRSWQFTRLI